MNDKLILHEYAASGNCYKIRLTAALVGVPVERREYDILKGETRTPEFLVSVNANGHIPVLQIGDRLLPESNAACYWLANESPFLPDGRFDHADMLRWMSWEQYNHEPNVATMRFYRAFVGEAHLSEEQRASIPARVRNGEAALQLMDDHLADRPWFVGSAPTLADICLFAYTHTAEEGGFDLTRYPAIGRWISAVMALRGFVTLSA